MFAEMNNNLNTAWHINKMQNIVEMIYNTSIDAGKQM